MDKICIGSVFSRLKELAESEGIRVEAGWRTAAGDFWEKIRGGGLGAIMVRGSAAAFAVKVTGAGLGFLSNVILARALGVRDYGTFVYVYAWIRILGQLSTVGFHNSLVRFVPEYLVKEKWALLKGLWKRSFQIVALVSGAVAVGLILFAVFRPDWLGVARIPVFMAAALSLPFLALMGVQRGLLRGLKRVALANIPRTVIRPGLLLIVAGGAILLLGEGTLNAEGATWIHGGAMVAGFAAGMLFLFLTAPGGLRDEGNPEYNTSQWMSVTLPLLLISSMGVLSRQMSLLMTGALGGDAAAGVLGVAVQISRLVVFGLSATNMIMAPIISELYYDGREEKLQRLLTIAAWGIFGFTVVCTAVLIVGGPFILMLFGTGFGESYVPLVVMLVGQVVNSCSGAVGYIMLMTGHHNQAAVIRAGAVVVNLGLCVTLVPLLGPVGGAIAMSGAMMSTNLIMVVYVWKKHGLNPTVLSFRGM